MCIKIVRLKDEIEYDSRKPLEDQIKGSKQVIVNYEPSDPSIGHFLNEVERLCKMGVSASLNIKFNHNNNLDGARTSKRMSKLSKDLDLNQFIKMVATLQHAADQKLEEISEFCLKR
jgi:hypothetical protein